MEGSPQPRAEQGREIVCTTHTSQANTHCMHRLFRKIKLRKSGQYLKFPTTCCILKRCMHTHVQVHVYLQYTAHKNGLAVVRSSNLVTCVFYPVAEPAPSHQVDHVTRLLLCLVEAQQVAPEDRGRSGGCHVQCMCTHLFSTACGRTCGEHSTWQSMWGTQQKSSETQLFSIFVSKI